MEKLIIEKTDSSPKVILDPNEQHYEITGRSFPENPIFFFETILRYIDSVFPAIEHPIRITIQADYYNSVSSRYLLSILRKFASLVVQGKKITVIWLYSDEESLRDGEMFKNIVNLPIEYQFHDSEEE
ncbi:MAG TPA: DUF1987 domain-containing protein [Salinivirgaceae bacterium]|nr:DUF1987 domain-containing protein [Salinivirgaceae bacterium]